MQGSLLLAAMSYRYRRWVDFGPAGRPPERVQFAYSPQQAYKLSDGGESVLDDIWTSVSETEDGLHDAPGFNLVGVTDSRVQLGPASFKHCFLRRLVLAEDERLEAVQIPPSIKERLIDAVHYLSSFVGVVTDGQLLVGIKPGTTERSPFLSVPGSGYLDREQDMYGESVAPTAAVVNRELQEEVGRTASADQIRCLGIFEDTATDSHLNPALFSLIRTDESASKVVASARQAQDADEFRDLALLPITEETIETLVQNVVDESALEPLSLDLPRTDEVGMSHKTLLLLLLLGRRRFGTGWFEEIWAQHTGLAFESSTA